MSDPRDARIVPVRDRDLEPVKRIEISVTPLIVGHLRAVVGHTRVISAGNTGAANTDRRQHRYHDSENQPLDTHFGLPDTGP